MRKNMKRPKHIINVIAGLIVVCLVCTGAVYDVAGVDVTITEIDEIRNVENTINIRSRQNSVSDIVSENHIEIGLFDKVNLDDDYIVENGDEIIIRRGVGITIEVDGTIITTSATSDTVNEALIENGIFLGEQDKTVPALTEKIQENTHIKVIKTTVSTVTREEIIPFEVIYKDDSSLAAGKTKVLKAGVDGKVCITENVVVEDGVEVSREEVSRETVVEKVDKVVARGTAKATAKSVSPGGFSYTRKLTMTATAYSAFNKSGGYGKTASGMVARYGVVAVDPKVIPLGTKLYVEGYGYAIAADTGGAIKGNKIDLCFEKPNKELMVFGRKSLDVYILN